MKGFKQNANTAQRVRVNKRTIPSYCFQPSDGADNSHLPDEFCTDLASSILS